MRRLAQRASPSPSPIRKSKTAPSLLQSRAELSLTGDNSDEDDEDEETLQLRLQEIQARLKLKKLQKSKAVISDDGNERDRISSLPARATSVARSRARHDIDEHRRDAARSQENVHVPVSPIRRIQPSAESPKSPRRVLLGIDKGLKAADVSLKRAPSQRKTQGASSQIGVGVGGYLHRSSSQASGNLVAASARLQDSMRPRSRTFNERLADIRTQEADRAEKDARIQQVRSKAFDINRSEMEGLKKAAIEMQVAPYRDPEFTREQVVNSAQRPASGLLQRSKSEAALRSRAQSSNEFRKGLELSSKATERSASRARRPISEGSKDPRTEPTSEPLEFETFSSLFLSQRIIPHTNLTRLLAGKKIYTLPDLLRDVTGPHFKLPDIEEDIVILGIIASKSDPKNHKTIATNEKRGKFMALKLVDLKWEIDMYLFDSAFDRFWKLAVGTVIAILNPGTMAPRVKGTNQFALCLNSSDDTILEIGSARDLGFCKAVKKDGKTCDAWIDKRHTEFCEFHINESLKKTKAGRMEVNTMNFGKGMFGGRRNKSRAVQDMEGMQERANNKAAGIHYDRGGAGKVYMHTGGRSAAALLDDMDVDPDAFHRGTNKEERMRRRLAEAEKERDIAKKLGAIGGGLGADYLRLQDQSGPSKRADAGPDGPPTPPDAATLGLLGGKAKEMHLSPIKRKRPAIPGSQTSSQSSSTSAMGWGGALSDQLRRMKDGASLQPSKKKTRFVTPTGIKEAGRESFGGEVATLGGIDDDDDDDDLDIIH